MLCLVYFIVVCCSLFLLIMLVILFQMAVNRLAEIHKDSHHWTICVLVSRMWHYRGGTDDGPIKHTDLVLLDTDVSATPPHFTFLLLSLPVV